MNGSAPAPLRSGGFFPLVVVAFSCRSRYPGNVWLNRRRARHMACPFTGWRPPVPFGPLYSRKRTSHAPHPISRRRCRQDNRGFQLLKKNATSAGTTEGVVVGVCSSVVWSAATQDAKASGTRSEGGRSRLRLSSSTPPTIATGTKKRRPQEEKKRNGAGTRSRTKDFHITNVALYQLSYTGYLRRREYSAG